ncbi:clustered mitochondria protein homolog [Hypomesus transpacificus]|uniref:clustered mitochondria protein homolog n=1 Tax=Hypomesus transpacificus TaxID=137520 RepID=UPI001F07DA6E|nr:clustered mitochondria protein homolog [Hypomesus transpacificus]
MKDKMKKGGRGKNQGATGGPTLTNGSGDFETKQEETASFPVKIQGSGVEPFELQVHGFWLVQDAVTSLLAREEVYPRSCLSLALAGMTLEPLVELQSLKGFRPGATLRLMEEPYSPCSAREHVSRVLELLRAARTPDALVEGRSPSLLHTLTHTAASATEKAGKLPASNTKTEPANQDGVPPEYLLPGSPHMPLLAVLPHSSQPETHRCLKDLSLSCWNPPPGHRKLQGDFLYITVLTLEGRRCDITSCSRGFYHNRSTEEAFDPRPASSTPVCHCLTDLLAHFSPGFKQALATLRNRPQVAPAEVLPTPYRTMCWLGPSSVSHLHRNLYSRLEEQGSAQSPDWNEELQLARDLPQGSLEERLQRDRALLQVNSAFVWATAQAAETVMDGFVESISGGPDDPGFLWGGLFLSRGGAGGAPDGERGRRAAQKLELRGVQLYSDLGGALQGLHTLPTTTVDYRGVRLSAQGLAPGLEGPLEQGQGPQPSPRGLLYGVSAGPQESPYRRRLLELLAQAAKALSLQRHAVLAPNGQQVPLFTSVDAQGVLGPDGRFYLLDLFRTLPADANYCPSGETGGEEEGGRGGDGRKGSGGESEEKEGEGWPERYHSEKGLPRTFPHRLCRLRPELVHEFAQHKQSQFTKRVRERMEENGGVEECVKPGDARGTDAVRGACKDVGSVSDIIFEMRFNPNIFNQGLDFPRCDGASVRLQKRLLREAAAFITTHQIPAFIEDCLQCIEVPLDGATLRQALHQKGINLRYLGQLTKAISQSDHKERLRHIMRLAVGEIVIRSSKRMFNNFLQGVEISSLSAAVSHFLCCLLVSHFSSAPVGEETKKRSRKRGRGGGASDSTTWSMLSGAELWNLIVQDATETYGITDELGSGPDHLVELYRLQKLSLLREFCLKTGVQLRLRDYLLDNRTKAAFGPDDVLNLFPVVKHITMTTADASAAFRAAQSNMKKGLLEPAYEHLKEASYLFGRVCDDLHPEACHCLSLMARVAYLQGQAAEARSVQLRAVVISERVLGFDHPNTIQQYVLLAVYVYAGGEQALSQRCLFRARLLMQTVHGEDHPYAAMLDGCLGLVLTGEQSGQYLRNALKLNTSFFGPKDLRTALSQHLLSQSMCLAGNYRSAINHEREALVAFTSLHGEDHPQTRCSSDFLRTITQNAVRVERSLRKGAPELMDTRTLETLTPSAETILEQLVLVAEVRRNTDSGLQQFRQKLRELREAEEANRAAQNAGEENASHEEPKQNGGGEETGRGEETGGGEENGRGED